MKRNNWIYLFLLIPVTLMSFSYSFQKEPHANLKVMTYNIWNGFDWGKDTIRKENWIKWIQDKNPDVLALQELCGYNEEKLKADASKWGHNYVKILKTEGYPVGLTSRKPIRTKELVTDELWHGLLHCETYGIDFFVLHLSPADCDFRLKEANIITEKIKESKSDNYIILGDFNAHSPFDEELLKNNKVLLKKYSNSNPDKYSNLRLGEFDYSVISRFLALPAIDVSKKYIDIIDRYTFPSPVLIGLYRNSLDEVIQTRERIDYVLTSPIISVSCINVTIFNKGEADTFSDHYPVMAEFNFETKN
jgi:exodeoxyribonuclease III